MRTKQPVVNFVHNVVDGNGEKIRVRINATPQFGENNQISGVIVSLEKV